MSLQAIGLRIAFSWSDKWRDRAIPIPAGVTEHRNIPYADGGKANLLDVYYPEGTGKSLPTIVSIHGGGYVYGDKELYRRYCMDLARRGFAVVNFNYRLAPKFKFPTPLEDTNRVFSWICDHQDAYFLDSQRLILVGDSAGAQLASQYGAIWANPEYGRVFSFRVPEMRLCALGLFCGMYDPKRRMGDKRQGIVRDYFGKVSGNDPRLMVLDAIDGRYPPAFVVTSANDFLRDEAEPMYRLLQHRGVKAQYRCYGTPEEKEIAHVFHLNVRTPAAKNCNDEACAFFGSCLGNR